MASSVRRLQFTVAAQATSTTDMYTVPSGKATKIIIESVHLRSKGSTLAAGIAVRAHLDIGLGTRYTASAATNQSGRSTALLLSRWEGETPPPIPIDTILVSNEIHDNASTVYKKIVVSSSYTLTEGESISAIFNLVGSPQSSDDDATGYVEFSALLYERSV